MTGTFKEGVIQGCTRAVGPGGDQARAIAMDALPMRGLQWGAPHCEMMHAEDRGRAPGQPGVSAAGSAMGYCAGVWRAMLCVLLLCLLGCGGRKLPEPGNTPPPTTPPSPVSPPSRPPP